MADTLYITPADLDVIAYQGDAFAMQVTVKDQADAVINLSGYSASMQVRADVADLALAVAATATVTITDSANGILEAVIDQSTMQSLAGNYRYDLQVTDDSGSVQTLLAGKFTVRQEITR